MNPGTALEEVRADFERRANRSLSLPIAGALVWAVVGVLGTVLPSRIGIYVLLFGTGLIFPLALLIARARGEQLLDNANPLAKLMAACVFMVNLLWALHLSLLLRAPAFVPLSVGIAWDCTGSCTRGSPVTRSAICMPRFERQRSW